MLLWKTSPSPTASDEFVHPPQSRIRAAPRNVNQVSRTAKPSFSTDSESDVYRRMGHDERRYIFKMVLMMLLMFVLPATLMLLYLFFNSEAFHYDITPKQESSSWLPGK